MLGPAVKIGPVAPVLRFTTEAILPLARLELVTALRVRFTRCPRVRLVEPRTLTDSWHFHGLDRIVVWRSVA